MLGRFRQAGFITLLLITVSVAGCADSSAPTGSEGDDVPEVQSTSTTGGIRGVIVDQSITPIADVMVLIKETGDTMTTDASGNFVFSGLAPGSYIIEASKPLYDTVQASTQVVAGVSNPDAVKLQLTRLTNQEPTLTTTKFDGYISCSANAFVPGIGGFLSEECGEGVGVPGAGRIGGNPDNNAQIDFFLDGPGAQTLIAEAVWEPSLSVGVGGQSGSFNMGIYTDFSCDPLCGWAAQIDRKDGGSPLYLRSDDGVGYDGDVVFTEAGFDDTTAFSTFTWAGAGESGVLIEQPFTVYITSSYLLPLPEGWSFVNGDPAPF